METCFVSIASKLWTSALILAGAAALQSLIGGQKGLRPMWAEDMPAGITVVVADYNDDATVLAEPDWWAGSDRESSSQELRLKTMSLQKHTHTPARSRAWLVGKKCKGPIYIYIYAWHI